MNYFDVTSAESGICHLCGASVNLKNGSKAPFLRHLKAKHPEVDTLLIMSSSSGEASENVMNIDNIENIPIEMNEGENSPKVMKSS